MKMKKVYIDLQPLLKKKDLNINKLSTITKVHRSVLHKLEEKESKRATISVLEKICTATHAHLNEFMFIEEEDPEPVVYLPPFDNEKSKVHVTCNLSSLLKKRGISLHQFSKDIDESYNNVWKVAANEAKQWSFSMIGKLLTHLDCSISELFSVHVISQHSLTIREDASPYGENSYEIRLSLDEILEKRDISMLQLSQKTELPYDFIRRMKNNDVHQLDLRSLEKLCNYLQVSPHDIIQYDKKK